MAATSLPTKLENEPLVDAVFEMRFTARTLASTVIPGILVTRLSGETQQIERLPAAEIPTEIRTHDPNLRFLPLMRLHWNDDFLIMVGDTTLGLGCKIPYAGWAKFKPHILKLFSIMSDTEIVERLHRYSMKYVAVIDGKDLSEQVRRIKISLSLGDYALKSDPFNVRIERSLDPFRHIMQIAAPATAQLPDRSQREGLLLDIDSICEHDTADFTKFNSELAERSEIIHERNKELFFELLTPETLAYLRPTYDSRAE